MILESLSTLAPLVDGSSGLREWTARPEPPAPSVSDEPLILWRAAPLHSAAARTIVHTYEPVRDDANRVIDFRLSFIPAHSCSSAQSFNGLKLVECGPSVAPGEIFHTLKRVLETGEALRTMTRHPASDLCFYQSAVREGGMVVTTTTIVGT